MCTLILQIETRNNKLEMQSVNNKSLIDELDKLLEKLRIPPEVLLLTVTLQDRYIDLNFSQAR